MVRDMNKVMQEFSNGLTVRELKELIKDWPEVDEHGEPTQVWFDDAAGYSNQVREVWPLNRTDLSFSS